MNTFSRMIGLAVLLAAGPVTAGEDPGLPLLDVKELLKRTLRDGTRAVAVDASAASATPNQIRIARTEPVRLKNARPSRVDFVFVVNEALPPPDGRPVDGIVPVLNEKVTRQLDLKREEWSERARANARGAFGNVPANFEETLYGDLKERHTDRLEAAGYVEKTLITVPNETAKMKLYAKEHYDPRDARDVRVEVTIVCAPRLMDDPDSNALGVAINARIAGPIARTATTGTLAELAPEHLQQFERRATKEAESIVTWFNKEPLRRVSIRRLEEARASGNPVTNALRYPWFGERGSINVSLTPPPAGALPDRDYSEEWGTSR